MYGILLSERDDRSSDRSKVLRVETAESGRARGVGEEPKENRSDREHVRERFQDDQKMEVMRKRRRIRIR